MSTPDTEPSSLSTEPVPASGSRGGPILEFEGVHLDYTLEDRTVHALQGLTLKAGAGEIVGLVGESGSGKSTVARAALGLLPQQVAQISSGTVSISGQDVTRLPTAAWPKLRGRPIAIVFQDPLSYLNPVMRIDRQIAEAAERHGSGSRSRVLELLSLVRLPAAAARSYAHELSGGMRQRVLLAIALACEPALLIADEPTTALDVTTQAEVIKLLREIQRELDVGVLFISHNLAVVAHLSDRVYVMYAGRVIESGPTEQLLTKPGHPYTLGLIRAARATRDSNGRYASISGEVPSLATAFTGCAFAARCPVELPECTTSVPSMVPVSGHLEHSAACVRLDTARGARR